MEYIEKFISFLNSKNIFAQNIIPISSKFTGCVTLSCQIDGSQRILKFETPLSEPEVQENFKGYEKMPIEVKPHIFGYGKWDSNQHYLIMEDAGTPFSNIIVENGYEKKISTFEKECYKLFKNNSFESKDEVNFYMKNFIISNESNQFCFNLFLKNIEEIHHFDTSYVKKLLNEVCKNIISIGYPNYISWSPQDFSINHIYIKNDIIKIIDPQKEYKGIFEIDLGRIYCMLEMFTEKWRESLPLNSVIYTEEQIKQPQEIIQRMAQQLRFELEGKNFPNLFELGKAYQFIIATRTRTGHLVNESFANAKKILSNLI